MISLSAALGVQRGDVVSFVGAGGKTSSLVRLAWELVRAGGTVVTTTTTQVSEPIVTEARVVLLEEDEGAVLRLLPDVVARYRLVALARGYASPEPADLYRKLRGVAADLPGKIAALSGVDYVLVEADGARGRSLKAPADHEPVVPGSTTVLVPVAGVDAVGRPLDETVAHRVERLTRLCGLQPGQVITPLAIAAVLAHPQGGLKGLPPGARVVPLLNKADTMEDVQVARGIAELLLRSPAIHRVVIGSVAKADSWLEVVGRTGNA